MLQCISRLRAASCVRHRHPLPLIQPRSTKHMQTPLSVKSWRQVSRQQVCNSSHFSTSRFSRWQKKKKRPKQDWYQPTLCDTRDVLKRTHAPNLKWLDYKVASFSFSKVFQRGKPSDVCLSSSVRLRSSPVFRLYSDILFFFLFFFLSGQTLGWLCRPSKVLSSPVKFIGAAQRKWGYKAGLAIIPLVACGEFFFFFFFSLHVFVFFHILVRVRFVSGLLIISSAELLQQWRIKSIPPTKWLKVLHRKTHPKINKKMS